MDAGQPADSASLTAPRDIQNTLDDLQNTLNGVQSPSVGPQNTLLVRSVDEKSPAGFIWHERLIAPITNVAIFGGSITFSVVVSIHDGASHFKSALPTFLALAWFFFVITLGLATAAQMAMSFYEQELKEAFTPPEWTGWRERGHVAKRAEREDHARGAILVCALFVNFKMSTYCACPCGSPLCSYRSRWQRTSL
jgi:hypothetical protein